jgi:4-amino-4-deoxy-L-arabinose transferase-like glycosyltransferase
MRKDFFYNLILTFFYFLSRIYRLTYYPIFSDEGIYIRWARIAWHDATWRFISLTDGRQPLQTWLTIPFMKLFSPDLLFSGRMFAVFGGFIGFIGIGALTYYLFGKRAAFFSLILYLIAPFFVFYDRIALIDTWVHAAAVWIMLLALLLARYIRLDISLLFGIVGGLFLLAKSSVMMFLGLSVLAPIAYFQSFWKEKRKMVNFILLLGVAVTIAYTMYNVQRLSPFFHYINSKNTTFILTPMEWIKNPFQVVEHNITHIIWYVMHNLGYGMFFVGLIGLYFIFKQKRSLFIFILVWFLGMYIPMMFFMKVLFTRYTIFISPIFIISAAYGLDSIMKKRINSFIHLLLWIAILAFPLYFNFKIYFDYAKMPMVANDRGQYIEDWPAGYGAKEIMDYIRAFSTEKKAVVLCEGNFGMAGDVLDVFKYDTDKIDIKPFWPLNEVDIVSASQTEEDVNMFVVFSHRTDFPMQWPMELVKEYKKPGGKASLYLFKILLQHEKA